MSLFDKISKVFDLAVKNEANIKKTIDYLVRFGYLNTNQENTLEDVLAAVVKLHTLAGLKSTDIISGKTLTLMSLPRCSLMDNEVESATNLNKWGTNKLTYCINSRDSDMSAQEWDACFKQAFNNWSDVCNLTFTQVSSVNQANLIINIGQGRQDDFDGPSGVLAWFQLPSSSNYSGRLEGKFDANELWGINRGILLVNVACHEIGHALGLTHSNISSALMAPFYSPSISKPQSNDDISRAIARYGNPINTPNVPPTPSVPVPTNPSNITINLTGSITKIDIPGYRISKVG